MLSENSTQSVPRGGITVPAVKMLAMLGKEKHAPEQSGLKLPMTLLQSEPEKYRTHSPLPLRQESAKAVARTVERRSFMVLLVRWLMRTYC